MRGILDIIEPRCDYFPSYREARGMQESEGEYDYLGATTKRETKRDSRGE